MIKTPFTTRIERKDGTIIKMRVKPDYQMVLQKANELLDRFEYRAPPVNPVEISRRCGIKVAFAEFDGRYDKISGFYDPEDNKIYVNEREFPLRQSFTVAHELGHALLHRDWAGSENYRILWRDGQFESGEVHEREANAFAANLLVPRVFLDRYVEDLSVQDLSRLFVVSVPMIKNRLSFEYGL